MQASSVVWGGDGVAFAPAGAVLLVDGELDAIGGRLATDRTKGKVRPDLDRALRPGAAAAAAAGERDERCHDEDSESPSSNHMVPPCVCREARRNPSWRLPPLIRRPLPNLSRGESAPATNAATWVAEPLLRGELSTCICLEVKRCFGSPFGASGLMEAQLYQ